MKIHSLVKLQLNAFFVTWKVKLYCLSLYGRDFKMQTETDGKLKINSN